MKTCPSCGFSSAELKAHDRRMLVILANKLIERIQNTVPAVNDEDFEIGYYDAMKTVITYIEAIKQWP
jgi:hypothetical protein